MTKKMLIDAAHPEEVRVAVLDNGKVEDFDFESAARKPLRGNIYLARVTRVEPSLQAAFVEYGGNRHGFLAFSEIHPDYYQIPVSDRRALQDAEAAVVELAAQLELTQRGDDDEDFEDEDDAAERAAARQEPASHDDHVHDDHVHDEHVHEEEEAEDVKAAPEAALAETEDDASDPIDEIENLSTDEEEEEEEDGEEEEAAAEASEDEDDDDADEDDAEEDGVAARNDDEDEAADDDEDLVATSDEEEDGADEEEDEDDDVEEEPVDAETARARAKQAAKEREALIEKYKEAKRKRAHLLRNYKIQEVIKRRQILLVQVVKEERGNKGAALTTYMSLAGRYCVLMPNTARGGGISRKIPHSTDRRRLRRVVDSLDVPQGMGLIIRTAGAKRTKIEIKRDYDYLLRLWENIRTLTLKSIAPCLIYEEASLIKRAIRDLYDKDIGEVLVEGDAGYREAKDFMKMLMPSHAKFVQPYKGAAPIFLKHGVEQQLDGMYQPTVRLKSGGYIVIHQTEALVAIDVNSGRATRERNIEQTALKTNIEAAYEAARQFRMRDLAGLIVLDFIDMEEPKNNRKVEKALKDAIKHDRARIQLGRISNFGLLEMSRQRRRSGIVDGTTQACPTCSGAGVIRSAEMAALRILRALEGEAVSGKAGVFSVHASLDVTVYVLNHHRDWLRRIEDQYGVTIQMIPDTERAGDDFQLEKSGVPRERSEVPQVIRADQTEMLELEEAPEVEAAADEEEAEERSGDRKKRRRRRRRRDKDRGDQAEIRGAEQETSGETETAADESDAEGEADGDNEREAREGGDDERGRRRRRRGRRGGRRNRRGREGGEESGVSDASGGEDADAADDEVAAADETSEQPKSNGHDVSDEPAAQAEEPEVIAAHEPQAEAEPEPQQEVEPEPEEAVDLAEAPQPVAAPPKAKKTGWWRRGSDA